MTTRPGTIRITQRLVVGCGLMITCSSAFAYIDPGVTYALLQALFVFVFGAAAAFIVRVGWGCSCRLSVSSKLPGLTMHVAARPYASLVP